MVAMKYQWVGFVPTPVSVRFACLSTGFLNRCGRVKLEGLGVDQPTRCRLQLNLVEEDGGSGEEEKEEEEEQEEPEGDESDERVISPFESPRFQFDGERMSSDGVDALGGNAATGILDSTVVSAKKQLMGILPYIINLEKQRSKVEQLIKFLENRNTSPMTEAFAELSIQGHWRLLYTTTTLGTPSTFVRLRSVEQEIDTVQKKIRNHVSWSLLDEDCHGKFTIVIKYKFVTQARLSLEVLDYLLQPQGKKMPTDAVKLSGDLQRALPREFFDPDSSYMDITYVDPDMRIARFMGKRYAGVRNILVRSTVVGEGEDMDRLV